MLKINKDFIKKIKKRTGFVLLYSTMLLNITACSSHFLEDEDDKSIEFTELLNEYEQDNSNNSENNKKTIQDVLKDFGYTDETEFHIIKKDGNHNDYIVSNAFLKYSQAEDEKIIYYIPQEKDNIFCFGKLNTYGDGTYTPVYYDLNGYLAYLESIEKGIDPTQDGYKLEFIGLVIDNISQNFKLNRELTEEEKNIWYSEYNTKVK